MLETFDLYNDLCVEIEVLKEQRQLAESEREQWWIGGRLFNTVSIDNAAERFDKLTTKIERIDKSLKVKHDAKQKIENLMNQYEELPRKIAFMRYVQGKTLKEISDELNYSHQYVRRIMMRMKRAM